MYRLYGLTIGQWLYILFVAVISVLVVGMMAAYYQGMERKVIENETDIKWLKNQNLAYRDSINTLSKSIADNTQTIDLLSARSAALEAKGRQISDSLKKIKLRYHEIPSRVDTIDVDGIRKYFSELPEIPKN